MTNENYELIQTVVMDGETKQYKDQVEVEVTHKNDTYFKYTETLDDHTLNVTLRLAKDFVKILRRGVINMNFHFVEGVLTDTFYESPAGRHHFQVYTTSLKVDENISIKYDLYEGQKKLGHYHYQLKKVG